MYLLSAGAGASAKLCCVGAAPRDRIAPAEAGGWCSGPGELSCPLLGWQSWQMSGSPAPNGQEYAKRHAVPPLETDRPDEKGAWVLFQGCWKGYSRSETCSGEGPL